MEQEIILKISYWAFSGTFFLILMTYKDIRRRLVDDRYNFLMTGLSISIVSHIPQGIKKLLLLIILIICLNIYLKYLKILGEGDVNALSWLFLGFGFFGFDILTIFGIFFLILTGLYTAFKYILIFIKNRSYKNKISYHLETPFFPVLLCAFILTCYTQGLYLI